MRIILYMATTINGFIAKEDDDTSWVTETEWVSFSSAIKMNGNMIIGRRTYEIMLQNNEFHRSNLNEVKTVVLSKDIPVKVHNPKFISVATSPREAVDILYKQGFETIMVCGGGKLNSSFMRENLIDEIYLDIEPIVFGKGIKLFFDADFETRLELNGVKNLSADEIQLHYKVIK